MKNDSAPNHWSRKIRKTGLILLFISGFELLFLMFGFSGMGVPQWFVELYALCFYTFLPLGFVGGVLLLSASVSVEPIVRWNSNNGDKSVNLSP